MRTVRIALEVDVPDGYEGVDDEELAGHVAAGIASKAEVLHFVHAATPLEHRLLHAEPPEADSTTVEAHVMDAVRDHGQMHEDGAPREVVLREVGSAWGDDAAQDALERLERQGEVYQPADGRYRTTSQRGADTQP